MLIRDDNRGNPTWKGYFIIFQALVNRLRETNRLKEKWKMNENGKKILWENRDWKVKCDFAYSHTPLVPLKLYHVIITIRFYCNSMEYSRILIPYNTKLNSFLHIYVSTIIDNEQFLFMLINSCKLLEVLFHSIIFCFLAFYLKHNSTQRPHFENQRKL